MNKKELIQIITANPRKSSELIKLESIVKDVCSAFNDVIQDLSTSVEISYYVSKATKRIYITLASKCFAHSYDTTLLSLVVNNPSNITIDIDCGIDYGFKLQQNIYPLNDDFAKELAELFNYIYQSRAFRVQINTIQRLETDSYRLTVFLSEIYRYLPDDLYIDLKRSCVENFKKTIEHRIIIIPTNQYTIIHHIHKLTEYRNKYAVVNGFVFKFLKEDVQGLHIQLLGK